MKDKQIAVIATILNEAKSLPQLLNSLFSQSISPDEIIIVDGGSSDGSWEILEDTVRIYPNFKAIRDVSCSLKHSPGPIARGRNVAIRQAKPDIIVCADAGCIYHPNWLEQIVAPLIINAADISIGGSCIREGTTTIWDVASAPFLGFDLPGEHMPRTATGTARSLAFYKYVWKKVEGFPEHALCGEDTEFIYKALKYYKKVFVPSSCAYYSPYYRFTTSVKRLARYASFDGIRNLTPRRFYWMSLRIICLLSTGIASFWSILPLLFYILFEIFYALRRDFLGMILDGYVLYIPARLCFSLMVPWVFTKNYIAGLVFGRAPKNEQNG